MVADGGKGVVPGFTTLDLKDLLVKELETERISSLQDPAQVYYQLIKKVALCYVFVHRQPKARSISINIL